MVAAISLGEPPPVKFQRQIEAERGAPEGEGGEEKERRLVGSDLGVR